MELSRRIENLRAQLVKLPQSIPQGEQSNPNEQLISNLGSRLADLQIEEQKLSSKYTDENRTLRSVREEIALIRKQIAEKEAKLYGRTSLGVSTTYLHLQEDQLRSEADLSSVKAKRESLQEQLSAYEKELAKFNQVETALNQLAQEVNVDRDNYRLYLTKSEESRINTAMDSQKIAGVSLLEPAYAPRKPVKPRVLLNLALGLFLGLFGALGLAFFIEFVSDDLERIEDVEAAFGLPVLSVIPELRRQPS
jgi:succinoglycan biosynthesis transport protein ExoP